MAANDYKYSYRVKKKSRPLAALIVGSESFDPTKVKLSEKFQIKFTDS